MRMRLLAALVAVAGLTAFAPAPIKDRKKTPARADAKSIQGVWKVISIQRGGQVVGVKSKAAITRRVRIQGNTWTFLIRYADGTERTSTSYQVVLDTSKKPTWIDLKRGAAGTLYLTGIVAVEGDTLKMMYGPRRKGGDGAQRPTSFEAAGMQYLLMTLQRDKP